MEIERANAYRHLLGCAMLDIRIGRQQLSVYNPGDWFYAFKELPRIKRLANDLHNLADYASRDFEKFDEGRFWGHFQKYNPQACTRYKRIFDSYLHGEIYIC